jgi:hypothetical protein
MAVRFLLRFAASSTAWRYLFALLPVHEMSSGCRAGWLERPECWHGEGSCGQLLRGSSVLKCRDRVGIRHVNMPYAWYVYLEHPGYLQLSGPDGKTIHTVGCPGGAVLVMYDDASAQRRDEVPVEVVSPTIHVLPRRLRRIGWRESQQIKCNFALLDEVFGGGRWEVRFCVGDGGNDVILAAAGFPCLSTRGVPR